MLLYSIIYYRKQQTGQNAVGLRVYQHGTGTTQQQLTVPDFRKTEIIIPPATEMTAFTETVSPLFQQMWANQDENNKLADIRDTLLPRLMSGEIDVSGIQL